MVHEKNIIIQLIKTVIFNRDTVGVLSFLLMVPAPGTEAVQCHCGENLSGRGGLMTGRRWGESPAVPSVEQAGIQGWGMCSQEPEEGVGTQGFVSSAGLQSMPNGIPPLCPAVSHPAVLSLRAWDMLTRGGDTTWKNLRLSWKDAKPSQFQGAKITQQGPAAT